MTAEAGGGGWEAWRSYKNDGELELPLKLSHGVWGSGLHLSLTFNMHFTVSLG